MSETGLVILVGGRPMPNLLAARHLKPTRIVSLASHESMRPGGDWDQLKPRLKYFCPHSHIAKPVEVDGDDPNAAHAECMALFSKYSGCDWVVNLTGGPKPMSLGAFSAATKAGASSWYLSTNRRAVKVLSGRHNHDVEELYRLPVPDYAACCGRKLRSKPGKSGVPTSLQVEAAQHLAAQPYATLDFLRAFRKARSGVGKLSAASPHARALCTQLHLCGCLDTVTVEGGGANIRFQIRPQWNEFLDGDWLEIYTWNAAHESGVFDDYRWGQSLPDVSANVGNEVDLIATWGAVLLVAECKTETVAPFNTGKLNTLDAIANFLGGSFVARLCIVLQPDPGAGTVGLAASFRNFREQAAKRKIVVVTGDQLGQLKDIMKQEVLDPTFPRI